MSQRKPLRRIAGALVVAGAAAIGFSGCVLVPAPAPVVGPPVVVEPRPPVVVVPGPYYGYHYHYPYRRWWW